MMYYGLSYDVDAGLDEDLAVHVDDAIHHLMVWQKIARTPGLRDRALEHAHGGWEYGNLAEYYGWGWFEGESSHLNRLMDIIEGPEAHGYLDLYRPDDEEECEMFYLLGDRAGEQAEMGEEDLLVIFKGEPAKIAWYLAALLFGDPDRLGPNLVEVRPTEEALRIREEARIDRGIARRLEDDHVEGAVLLRNHGMEPYLVYDDIFPAFLKAWVMGVRWHSTTER